MGGKREAEAVAVEGREWVVDEQRSLEKVVRDAAIAIWRKEGATWDWGVCVCVCEMVGAEEGE